MHAAPVFPALPGRYAAAARPLLGLIHMHTHTYSQTPTQHTHAYKGVGGGENEHQILPSKLSRLPVTHIFLH